MGNLSILFLKWFRIRHSIVVLMYFISTALIVFNLMAANIAVNFGLSDRPETVREYAGGTMDITGGKYLTLNNLFKISAILSFISIWLTTVLMTHFYRDRLVKREFRYWILPILLLFYFFVSYFSQDIISTILPVFLRDNPYLLSGVLIMVFALVKPIGGIMFGLVFWNLSRAVSYEKSLRKYMVIAGFGLLLLFSANQSSSLVLTPYPPFGLATISILITSAYLTMIGVYASAIQISSNTQLRISIQKGARESGLLGTLGSAERQDRINKTIGTIVKKAESSETPIANMEIDRLELRNYLSKVIQELHKNKDSVTS